MVDMSLEKESKKEKESKIKQLEREIKYHKKNKNKIIFKNTIKGVLIWSATVIVTAALGSYFVLNKNVPGRKDYINAHAFTTTKYSSLTGEVETDKEYKYGGTLEKDELCYYGPWEEQNDGTYKCDIKKYELKDVTEEQIKELLSNDDVSLEDILALDMKPVDSSGYITNNLTSEEFSNNPYYEITVYDEDKEDKLLKLQTKDDSFNDVAAISVGVILAGFVEIYAHITFGDYGRIYDSPYYDKKIIEDNAEKIKQLKKELNTGK